MGQSGPSTRGGRYCKKSFLSWVEKAFVLGSSQGLWLNMDDSMDNPLAVLEESVKLEGMSVAPIRGCEREWGDALCMGLGWRRGGRAGCGTRA